MKTLSGFCWLYWPVEASTKKITKKINVLLYKICKNIIELWDVVQSSFKIKFSNFFFSSSVILELSLFSNWFLMVTVLGWFLYLRITLTVGFLIISKKGLLVKYLVMPRFYTLLEKKLFRISAISRSFLTSWPLSVNWFLFLPAALSR